MKSKPDYIRDEQTLETDESKLDDLRTLVKEVVKLQQRKEAADKKAKEISSQIAEREALALSLMDDAGIAEFKTKEGHSAYKREFVTPSITDDAAFLAELKERGEAGLVQIGISGAIFEEFEAFFKKKHKRDLDASEVKLRVHHKTLQSYCKERGDDKPKGVSVKQHITVKIRRKKG